MTKPEMIQQPIYFDNAATTRMLPEALDAFIQTNQDTFGNSSSSHFIGKKAAQVLEQAQSLFAEYFQVPQSHIIFTSGGTESNNLAIWGALGGLTEAFYWLRKTHSLQKNESRLLTSTVEHPSTQKVFETLESMGALVGWVGVDENCFLNQENLKQFLDRPIQLASFHHAQSEIGVFQNIPLISKNIRQHSPHAILHIDAVQSFLKTPLNFQELGVDLISISSHKIGGPKGIGALILGPRFKNKRFGKLIEGSAQQFGIRPGTVALPLITAFASALKTGLQNEKKQLSTLVELRNYFIQNLPKEVILNGPLDFNLRTPQTVNFSIPFLNSSLSVEYFSEKGFCISAGSACSAGSTKPNQTILEMGLGKKRGLSSVRVSFSVTNTHEEIDLFLNQLRSLIQLESLKSTPPEIKNPISFQEFSSTLLE